MVTPSDISMDVGALDQMHNIGFCSQSNSRLAFGEIATAKIPFSVDLSQIEIAYIPRNLLIKSTPSRSYREQ